MKAKIALCVLFLGVILSSSTFAATVTEEWAVRYNGPANYRDAVSAMAVDTSGNVYVTGGSHSLGSGTNMDYATVKYSQQVAEDCTNGIDDDGDTLIDCADPDCADFPDCLNNPPDCSGAFLSLEEIWPPNHNMVSVEEVRYQSEEPNHVRLIIIWLAWKSLA